MRRIFDITLKDLTQLLRERETFLFLLIMPIAFTLLFGFAFGGFGGGETDPRLPVGYLDLDESQLSRDLHDLLADSGVIRLAEETEQSPELLMGLVADEELAGAIIAPAGYGGSALHGAPAKLTLIADISTRAGRSVQSELLAASGRLSSAVRTAQIVMQVTGGRASFDASFQKALDAWSDPPITVASRQSAAIDRPDSRNLSLAHTSPGMMLQFSIAGLMTAAQVLVNERKTRVLQRLLTTATSRLHILLGHFLAMLVMILAQFALLIGFAQLALKVDYMRLPLATALVAFSGALCIAAMGLLIGTLAKSEEQAVIFSLVPMFLLAGLGGAWVPLEVTGASFQAVGHLSPVAWGMDGFKNIVSRGLGIESVLLPAGALLGYAALFFALGAWRFYRD
ncbi:MAG TPA: ABC transporter permease [Anaerolineales bacterium]|nr:ABC transporter permease [Anaerolineales bacterium]